MAKAREACSETAQKLFGLTIQPEKELVLIVVPGSIRQAVMAGHLHRRISADTAPCLHLFAACQRGAGPAVKRHMPFWIWVFLQSYAYLRRVFA